MGATVTKPRPLSASGSDDFVRACATGDAQYVRKRVSSSTWVRAHNDVCHAGLVASCRGDMDDVLDVLLACRDIDPSANDSEALRVASECGQYRCVMALLRDGRADPTADDNYCIRVACSRCHVACIDSLLADSRVDPSARNYDCLIDACDADRSELLQSLLRHPRVDPSACATRALHFAVLSRSLGCLSALLADARVDPRVDGDRVLKLAIEEDNAEAVCMLVVHGAVDTRPYALTAYQLARRIDCRAAVRCLIERHPELRRVAFPFTYAAKAHRGMCVLREIVVAYVLMNPHHPIGMRRVVAEYEALVASSARRPPA